jgi:hypothetical protein
MQGGEFDLPEGVGESREFRNTCRHLVWDISLMSWLEVKWAFGVYWDSYDFNVWSPEQKRINRPSQKGQRSIWMDLKIQKLFIPRKFSVYF